MLNFENKPWSRKKERRQHKSNRGDLQTTESREEGQIESGCPQTIELPSNYFHFVPSNKKNLVARKTTPDEEVEGRDKSKEQGGQNNLFNFHIGIAARTLSVIFVF